MSVTGQFVDFSDLYTGLLRATRTASVTATQNEAKQYICTALYDMHLGQEYRFPWAERVGRLVTQDDYTTGTITTTKGSVSFSGASTAWNTNNSFSVANMRTTGKILIGSTVYRIATVTSDTAGTFTNKFTETSVSAGGYTYFEDEYDLASDFLMPVSATQFADDFGIQLIGRTEFRERYRSNSILGRPTVACFVDYAPSGNTTPIRRVRLYPVPDDFYSIEYTYLTSNLATSSLGVTQANFSADADEPIVPVRLRHAILYHALARFFRDKKDDTRSAEAKAEYTDIMLRAIADTEFGDRRPTIRPRVHHYAAYATRPYRSHGYYSTNNDFDYMR